MIVSSALRLRPPKLQQTTRRCHSQIDLRYVPVFCQKGFGKEGRSKKGPMSTKGISYKQLKEKGVLNTDQGWLPVAKLTDFKVSPILFDARFADGSHS